MDWDWTNDVVMRFLELYQMHGCIWDPKNAFHKNKNKVNDAWCDIKKELKFPGSIKELKKKRESLMSAYRTCKVKIKKSEKSGSGLSDIYKPTWFAFELTNSFLDSVYTCKQSVNTEDGDNQNIEENSNQTVKSDPVAEADISNSDHDSVSSPSVTNIPATSQQRAMSTTKRRQHDPPELIKAKNQMNQAFNILKSASQRQSEDDDECTIFGKLIAKKLRRLSVNRRDLMMIKINNLIYEDLLNAKHEHQDRPNSSSSTRTSDMICGEFQDHNRPKSASSSSNPYYSIPSPLSTIENQLNIASNEIAIETQELNRPNSSSSMIPHQHTSTTPSPPSTTEHINTMSLPLQGEPNQPRLLLTQDGIIIREDLMQEFTYRPNIIYEGSAEEFKEFIISVPPKK